MSFKNQPSPFYVEFFCGVFDYFVRGAKAHCCFVFQEAFWGFKFSSRVNNRDTWHSKIERAKECGVEKFLFVHPKKALKPYV